MENGKIQSKPLILTCVQSIDCKDGRHESKSEPKIPGSPNVTWVKIRNFLTSILADEWVERKTQLNISLKIKVQWFGFRGKSFYVHLTNSLLTEYF